MTARLAAISGYVLVATLLSCVTRTASSQSPEQVFRDSVLHKQRFLRDFHAESMINAEWDQGMIKVQAPPFRTFGLFVADAITTKSDSIELNGVRYTVDYKPGGKLSLQPARTRTVIRVSTHSAPANDVFALLDAALFYSSADETIAALREGPRYLLKEAPDPVAARQKKACDCADLAANGCSAKQADLGMKGMKNPNVLRSGDPEFTEEARQARYSGIVEVGLTVNISGRTSEWWITKSAGMGLDSEAVKALTMYQFAPATCRDKPVPVMLFIDMNFQQ